MIRYLFVSAEELPGVASSPIFEDDTLAWQLRLGPLSGANLFVNPGSWVAEELVSVLAFDDEAPVVLPRTVAWSKPRVWINHEDIVPTNQLLDEGWKLPRPTAPSTNRFKIARESDTFLGVAPAHGTARKSFGLGIWMGLGIR
jgi:hypothetical protein